MKKVFIIAVVFGLLSGAPLMGESKEAHYGKIDTKGVQILIESGLPVTLLDARKHRYDDGWRIPGAYIMPPSSRERALSQVIPSKETLIVVYCSNVRCPLSHELADSLIEKGYNHVLLYPYGMKGWTDGGHELEESNR